MTVQTTTLANGLQVVSDSMENVETVSTGIWVDVGTRYETPDINGVSHFLEHMAFKGTERRTAREIVEEIEDVGGNLNAYTSRETTVYHAKVLKEDLPLAVDIISDIAQNPTFDVDELERERGVILQEINQSNDTPDDVVFDYFQETAYPNQALGRPVLGTTNLVSNMSRESLMNYMKTNYTGTRMVFSAAGNLEHDKFVKMAEEAFDGLKKGTEANIEAAHYTGGDFRKERELEQTHILLGFDGVNYNDNDFYTASVLSTLLGGGMSSRLFQEIRENHGLVYSIYSFLSCYSDGGMFGIYAGSSGEESTKVIPLICEEMRKACDDITTREVERTRTQLKASILMSLESTMSRCEQLARQIAVFGRPLSISEVVEKIEAVDVEAVKKVAQRIVSSTPTVTALGPVSGLESYEETVSRMVV
jgi:predicted Zn-dependent peptidase